MQHKLSPFYGINKNCIFQIGYNRSVIFNLETEQHWFIDNKWKAIFAESPVINTKKVLKFRPDLTQNELAEFLSSNSKNGILRIINDPNNYEADPFELKRDHSSKLKSLSVVFRSDMEMRLFSLLKLYPTEHLTLTITELNNLFFPFLSTLTENLADRITLIIEPPVTKEDFLYELIALNPLIKTIYVSNQSPIKNQKVGFCEFKLKEDILAVGQPDITISKERFNATFQYHSYFYKRAHIKSNGDVTHSPQSSKVYGNIRDEAISDIIRSKSFQSIWTVKKHEIDVCNHCEFAPVCHDKRPLIRRSNGTWYSNIECAYNPYISKVKTHAHYLSLEECGISSSPIGFRIEISAYLAAKSHIAGKEKRAKNPYKG